MRKSIVCLFLLLISFIVSYQQSFAASPDKLSSQQVQASLRNLPLAFEQNNSRGDSGATYLVRRPEMSADFACNAVNFSLPVKDHAPARLAMSFFGHTAALRGEQELSGKINYLHGSDPANWRTGVSTYSQIRYAQLWPGVDLVFYGNGESLEHDFVVSPGADPKHISFELDGAQHISLTRSGDLLVQIAGSSITFKKPVAYEDTVSGRKQVAASYKLAGNKVSFSLGHYNRQHQLTIDPVLVFSTLLAGSTGETVSGMAVDALGNIYLTGQTSSTDFPTASPEQAACADCPAGFDAFVTKLNPTGTALVYSTFLGGSNADFGWSVAVDSGGNAIVAGITKSADFPAVHPIGTLSGTDTFNLFISSLSPTGASLNYSGVVGPMEQSVPFGQSAPVISLFVPLTVDSSGNAYLAAQTLFSTFPTTSSAIAPVPSNPLDAVLVALKVDSTGALVYSTAIPGQATPAAGGPGPNTFFPNSIRVDSAGSAYISGKANSGLPTTPGVIGGTFVSDSGPSVFVPQEGFVLKLNTAGSALSYATYVPGTSTVNAMRVDASGNAYLGGITSSTLLPISANAFKTDTGCTGCASGYLLKLNAQATAALGGTYLHGDPPGNFEQAQLGGIAVDGNGNIFVSGIDAATYPPINSLVQMFSSYIIEVRSDFSGLLFSSGGPNALIEIAPAGKIILAGNSIFFPSTAGSFEPNLPVGRGNPSNVPTIIAIDLTGAAPALCRSSLSLDFGSGVVAPGTTSAPQSTTVTNCGNGDLHISSVTTDSPSYTASTNCPLAPAGIAPGSSCTVSATYSPVNYISGNLLIADDAQLSPQAVTLVGFPKAPFTLLQPTSLSYPETPLTSSFGLDVQIADTGITNLTISSMKTTGDFSVSQNCLGTIGPPTILPGFGVTLHPCDFVVFFNPTATGTRTGTVIINDTSLDSPHIIQLTGTAITAWPLPAVADGSSVNVAGTGGNAANSVGKSQTLVLAGSGFSRVTTATLDGLIYDNNSFFHQFKLVSPQELDLTMADTDFADVGEVPVTVTSPAPGGGTTSTVATISSPVKFNNLLFHQIGFLGALNTVVGPKTGLIYGALGNSWVGVDLPNLNLATIAVVDPQLQRLSTAMVSFPHTAQTLAISDDEQFLYAAFSDNNTVAQISLPSGNINFMASLGQDPVLGNYNATSIRVMPGHPHTWVAALQPAGASQPTALKIFDDSTARANGVVSGNTVSVSPGKLLFVGSDTSTVYSIDSNSLYRFTIDASGVTLEDRTTGLGAIDFDTDGSLLYLSTGAIIDPATLTNKGNFALVPGLTVRSVVVDGGTSRAIFAGDGPPLPNAVLSPHTLVQGFDTKTLAAKGSFNIPVSTGTPILRWGTNGLALGFTLTRSSLTGNSGLLAPFHIGAVGQAPIGTGQISPGDNATFSLGITAVNGFNGPITLSCENLPQAASCSFSQNPVTPGTNFTVTIATHQAATASAALASTHMRSGSSFIVLTGLLAMPFVLVFARQHHRRKLLCVCLLLAMVGCGGGSRGVGGPTPTPTPAGSNTPFGTYDVILTGTSSAGTRHAVLQVIVL